MSTREGRRGGQGAADRCLAMEIAKDYALAVASPITKQIVCLANSRKPPSGRCIAGREYSGGHPGPWI